MKGCERLRVLYESEINWSISCFYDGGFEAILGDSYNGQMALGLFHTLNDAVDFLWEEAQMHYPLAECFK